MKLSTSSSPSNLKSLGETPNRWSVQRPIKTAWPSNSRKTVNGGIRSRDSGARRVKEIQTNLSQELKNPGYDPFIRFKSKQNNNSQTWTPTSDSVTGLGFMKTTETFLSNANEKSDQESCSTFKEIINSKVINQKGILERSYKLSQLRKKYEDTIPGDRPKSELKNSWSSPKLAGDKTLTRFVDQLILVGSLPLEAVEYFCPETPGGTATKEPRKLSLNSFTPKKPSLSIKSTQNQSVKESLPITPAADIIPKWMRANPKFTQLAGIKRKHAQNVLYRILSRPPNERDPTQIAMINNWLRKVQLFSKLPDDNLIQIANSLEPMHLNEGEILCQPGDPADCAYLIYEGQISIFARSSEGDRLIEHAGPGEILGKQALEKSTKRTARLQATKPTYLVAIPRDSYQNSIGEIKALTANGNSAIYDFLSCHDFLKTFSEVKRHMLANNLILQKFLKNDIVYNMDSISDKMYIVMSGKVIRRMPVTIDKANKWPTGLYDWRICKIIKTYQVTLPIATGEIFGVSEMIEVSKRKEEVLVNEDAQILVLSREMFYQIFEEDDVFKFQKKIYEDDKKKAEKIKRMFEQQEKQQKVTTAAMSDAFYFNLNNKTYHSFREISEKAAEWKKLEKGMTKEKSANKVVISVQEVIKDVHSVYET